MHRPSGALWHHRDFMKMWTGQTISQFGSSISQLALPIIAIKTLHASPFAVAALGTVEFAPFLLFTLPAGVWVDRLPRRSVLIVGDVGRGLLLLSVPIAYLWGHVTMAQLFAVGFTTGILTVFFDVAYQSYLPALVDREYLIEGNSKLEVTRSAGQLAGPAAAGGLIQALTAPYAVVWDSVSFFISGAFLVAIRKKEPPLEKSEDGRRAGMRDELWEGLLYVVKHPYLRPQAISTGTSNFFSNVAFSIIVVFAVRTLHMSVGLIGVVFALGSIGWLAGAALAPRTQRWLGVGGATILGAALSGPGTLLVALTPKSFPVPFLVVGHDHRRRRSRRLQHPAGLAPPGDHARTDAGPDELRDALPRLGADPARRTGGRRDRHELRPAGGARCRRRGRLHQRVADHLLADPEAEGDARARGSAAHDCRRRSRARADRHLRHRRERRPCRRRAGGGDGRGLTRRG